MEPINTRHDQQQGGGKKWVGILVIIILLAAIGGGVFFFMNKNKADTEEANTSPTSAPLEEQPTPTEEEVDLTAFKIEVLNGTEVEGEAGRLKTALEEAGFTVDSVANADKQDYPKSIIQAKSSVSEGFIKKLKTELEKTYPVGSDETLEDSDDHDVVVIIGGLEAEKKDEEKESSDSAETEDPTETPEPSETPAN